MTPAPLLLGAGALAAVALLLSSGRAAAAERKIAVVIPSRRRRDGGRQPVVDFTTERVLWRRNKKTGKEELRTRVTEEPKELASEASRRLGREIPLGVFSLATMMASEVGAGEDLAKVAVAHAALTRAKATYAKNKKGLHQILTSGDGHYGSQQGRYASTRVPPTERDVELAEAVTAGKIANPTPGADQWDSPRTQDKLHEQGEAGYASDADDLARRRREQGKVAVYLPGVDPGYLRLWRAA